MRLTILAAFSASVCTSFTSTVGPTAFRSTSLSSTVAPPEEATETSTETKKSPRPTRFDALKKRYKGISFTLPTTEGLGFTYEEFDTAVDDTAYSFNRNDVVKGTVVQYENGGAMVDIGAKANAFLPTGEATLSYDGKVEVEEVIDLNQEMDFQIISEEDENGQLLVSVKRIMYKQAWERVVEAQAKDEVFNATVVSVNRGGALCLVEGLRAFLPGSHVTGQPATEDLIGSTVSLKFLEVDPENNKLVVSNRRAVVEQQMSNLSRGDIVSGVVKALKPYGAFVDIRGMSALLHISQVSYDRIEDLEKVVSPGMMVKCMIIDHDKVNGRIALSTKTLEPQPGDMLKDASKVFDLAEETAAKYHERMENERKQREASARDIVLGLGDSLDALSESLEAGSSEDGEEEDPLAAVSDSLDALLS